MKPGQQQGTPSPRATWVRTVTLMCAILVGVLVKGPTETEAAATHVVVDISGDVEDFAAIMTLLLHGSAAELKLITVSGVTWGHGTTVAKNVCRFLTLSERATVMVALGSMNSMKDEYDPTAHRSSCYESQGFPLTPHDAQNRGMPYSRADVTSVYSAAFSLPPRPPGQCEVVGDATKALISLANSIPSTDVITYISLGSLTNLATALDEVRADYNTLNKLLSTITVYSLATGHNYAADSTAAAKVFAQRGLAIVVYPPRFYATSLRFTPTTWGQLSSIAKITSVPALRWVQSAWTEKRKIVEGHDTSSASIFFDHYTPIAPLVVLCAVDTVVARACRSYLSTPSSAWFSPTRITTHPTGSTTIEFTGDNVTTPAALQYPAPPLTANAAATSTAIAVKDAATPIPPSEPLTSIFWNTWLEILQNPR